MKYFFQLAILLLPLASSAQNILFLPFGQTQVQVDSFLQTRDYLDVVELINPEILSGKVDSTTQVKYYFKTDKLYAVEDKRFYHSKKDAQLALEACLAHLRDKGEVFKAFNTREVQHFVSVDESKMTEVIIYFNTRPFQAEVHLKSTSRMYGPRMKTESFIAELTAAE